MINFVYVIVSWINSLRNPVQSVDNLEGLSVSALIAKVCERVKIYELPGSPLDEFWSSTIPRQFTNCVNETYGGFMAQTYGEASGEFGVLIVTTGPGVIGATSPMKSATFEQRPLLVIAPDNITKYNTNQSWQYVDYEQEFKGIAKSIIKLERADDILMALTMAIDVAKHGTYTDPYPGSSLVVIPSFLFTQVPKQLSMIQQTSTVDDSGSLDDLIDALKGSTRPLVIAGRGILASGAYSAFVDLVERLQIPVVVNWDSTGMVPSTSPYYFGKTGSLGTHQAQYAIYSADMIIEVGNLLYKLDHPTLIKRFNHLTIPPRPSRGYWIVSPIAPRHDVYYTNASFVPLSPPAFVSSMLTKSLPSFHLWSMNLQLRSQAYNFGARSLTDGIRSLEGFCKCVNDNLQSDDHVCTGVGNHWYEAGKQITRSRPHQFVTSAVWASIGCGISFGIGVSDATEKRVIVIEGDGGFLWAQNSLAMFTKPPYRNRPFVIFVCRDEKYSAVESSIQAKGLSRDYIARLTEYTSVNYQSLAEAYSLEYALVSSENDVVQILANSINKPLLVEVPITNSTVYEIDDSPLYIQNLLNNQTVDEHLILSYAE